MRKLTQLELLEEGFLDAVRRAGGIARAAVKGAAKGIYAMDPGGFDTIAAPFKTIAAPITGALKQIKQDDPVSFLKDELKTYRSMELVKVVSQKTQNADTSTFKSSNRTSSTQIKNLLGISKNVTIITFWGTTYRTGTERQYKAYGEASELIISYGDNMIPIITQLEAARSTGRRRNTGGVSQEQNVGRDNTGNMSQVANTQQPATRSTRRRRNQPPAPEQGDQQPAAPEQENQQPPAPEQGDQQPIAPEQEDQQPPVPGAKLMTAEVFRTSKGLVLGDIYDPKTGDVISEYREKQQPFSFENAKANFFANQQPPISPNTTELSVQDATNLIKYLFQIKSKNYDTAQPAKKSGFEAILSNATAASAKVKVSDIKSVAKQTRIAENTHISQKVLLEQISRL